MLGLFEDLGRNNMKWRSVYTNIKLATVSRNPSTKINPVPMNRTSSLLSLLLGYDDQVT